MIADSNGVENTAMEETIQLINKMFPPELIDDYYEMKSNYEKRLREQILAQ